MISDGNIRDNTSDDSGEGLRDLNDDSSDDSTNALNKDLSDCSSDDSRDASSEY